MLVRIQAEVKEVQGKNIFLVTDDKQELKVAMENPTVKIGDIYTISILPQAEAEQNQTELARTILNTLIKDEQSPEKNGNPA